MKKIIKENHIYDEASRQLRVSTTGTRTPLFYGTVKIHKPDLPLRPIVSMVGSAIYDIAKFVNRA